MAFKGWPRQVGMSLCIGLVFTSCGEAVSCSERQPWLCVCSTEPLADNWITRDSCNDSNRYQCSARVPDSDLCFSFKLTDPVTPNDAPPDCSSDEVKRAIERLESGAEPAPSCP